MKKATLLTMALFITASLFITCYAQNTISVAIQQQDTVYPCGENLFFATLAYSGNGSHQINLSARVDIVDRSCNTAGSSAVYIKIDSVLGASNVVIVNDTAMSQVSFTNTTTPLTIRYHLYIDCSVLPSTFNVSSISVLQTWQDNAALLTYDVDSTNNIDSNYTVANILVPSIIPPSNLSFCQS